MINWKISAKYLKIAAEGNQSIAGTLTKFIGEMEYLFINAVKIEYSYYTKKEQARQEQLALKEQMRQEAEERKALEAERKKVEKDTRLKSKSFRELLNKHLLMPKLRNYVPEFLSYRSSFLMLLLKKRKSQIFRMVRLEMCISSVI